MAHLSVALAVAVTMSASAMAADGPIEHPFRVDEDKTFAPVETTLDALIARRAQTDVNHLCVIGQPLEDGTEQAWVYWREGRALILWEPSHAGIRELAFSRRFVRLDHDVVPVNDKHLAAGSSYLVSDEWANGVIDECRSYGSQFIIDRHKAVAAVQTPAAAQ
jgi:hypothetical protein